jgi:hypothetical protein
LLTYTGFLKNITAMRICGSRYVWPAAAVKLAVKLTEQPSKFGFADMTGYIRDPLYRRRQFPPEVIAHTVSQYFRFPLNLRTAEIIGAAFAPVAGGGGAIDTAGLPTALGGGQAIERHSDNRAAV